MSFTLSAACGCNTGRIRKNNEDNFCFFGKYLEAENDGLKKPLCCEKKLKTRFCVAVFDGMGGENYGEDAAFAAAKEMKEAENPLSEFFISERKYLDRLSQRINKAVVASAKELGTSRMGSTMVALYFTTQYVYVCNLGDSRAYRLRDKEFMQISKDHVCERPGSSKKVPLSQHLGIDPEDMIIEPYIAKGELHSGDIYLLCSDGLTDMVSNVEITDILTAGKNEEACVNSLIHAALEHGGKDNITAIVCRIK